jgi:hypothetical protein
MLSERYVKALTEFTEQNADHPMVYEARYRLAEYRQSHGDYGKRSAAYAAVERRSRRRAAGALRQPAEPVRAVKSDTIRRRARRGSTRSADLDALWAQAKALETQAEGRGRPALQGARGKATLLQAVYLSRRADRWLMRRVAAYRLADFDTRCSASRRKICGRKRCACASGALLTSSVAYAPGGCRARRATECGGAIAKGESAPEGQSESAWPRDALRRLSRATKRNGDDSRRGCRARSRSRSMMASATERARAPKPHDAAHQGTAV